jgi:hypothetical protein
MPRCSLGVAPIDMAWNRFTTAGFARMIEQAGSEACLGCKACRHELRHTCGYALGTTPEPCRLTWAIGISNTQCDTRNYRRRGFGISGESESMP